MFADPGGNVEPETVMLDEADPRRPDDPWWRSRTARRSIDPAVGAMLADHRRARGWSLADAATVTGLSSSYLWKLEAACRAPSLRTVAVLSVAYDLDDHDRAALLAEHSPHTGRASPYLTGRIPVRAGAR